MIISQLLFKEWNNYYFTFLRIAIEIQELFLETLLYSLI
jgi:hypothetical protein